MEKTVQCRIAVPNNNRLIWLIIGLLFFTAPFKYLYAQNTGTPAAGVPVTGIINDERGNALPGVSVVIKGANRGTTSDSEGRFQLTVPSASSTLIFSFVGYASQEVAVGNKTALTPRIRCRVPLASGST